MVKLTGLFFASAMAVLQPTTVHASPQSYVQGHQDRVNWESWYSHQVGVAQMGAAYWASQRSLPHPGTCEDYVGGVADAEAALADGAHGPADALIGCQQAQEMLTVSDMKRHLDPDYRSGWNAPVETTVEAAMPPGPELAEHSPVYVAPRQWTVLGWGTNSCEVSPYTPQEFNTHLRDTRGTPTTMSVEHVDGGIHVTIVDETKRTQWDLYSTPTLCEDDLQAARRSGELPNPDDVN